MEWFRCFSYIISDLPRPCASPSCKQSEAGDDMLGWKGERRRVTLVDFASRRQLEEPGYCMATTQRGH
jgi:hypothetical protein